MVTPCGFESHLSHQNIGCPLRGGRYFYARGMGLERFNPTCRGAGWAIPAGRNCLLTICLRQIGNESHLSHPQVLSLSPNHPFPSKSVFLLFLDKSQQISYTNCGKPVWVKDAVTFCVQDLSGTRWAFLCHLMVQAGVFCTVHFVSIAGFAAGFLFAARPRRLFVAPTAGKPAFLPQPHSFAGEQAPSCSPVLHYSFPFLSPSRISPKIPRPTPIATQTIMEYLPKSARLTSKPSPLPFPDVVSV